ncbi:hypothetical protein KPP03845_102918 [Streptomyces xanthophaeus]|uniref:hypothetical protein n=1 Tax=Streptomyces xanthophaeus TaxID=67385 RepID=UPI00233F1E15|nr:hypothetical protein [Streptomyces xanthophaeus]WCD86567.1 hypothetical protein KPP03845_102918 [Streptomyces xanthophaeus]
MPRPRTPQQQRALRRRRRRERIRAKRPVPPHYPAGLLVAALVLMPPWGIPAVLECDWPKARRRWAAGLSVVWFVHVGVTVELHS